MRREISNTDDVIDSRDVIARVEELEEQQAGEEVECSCDSREDGEGGIGVKPDTATCGGCGFEWCARCEPTPASRCPNEANHLDEEEAEELRALKALAEEAEGYAADWHHGEALIRDSYFQEYAQELAEDCGMLQNADTWPGRCIDWEQAARELQQDYTSVDFDGVTYWVR